MSKTASDMLLERLAAWGVKRIFGYPGDGINGIMGALDRLEDKIKFVQVRHEEMAAFMACAHAKFTGEVGVCLATSGPGAIHLLNGLYDAKLDHQPVLAIVGQQARSAIGTSYQQEVDLLSLFKDVAGEYVQVASDPTQLRHLIDRSLRIAKAERTVTCLIIPKDVQELTEKDPPHAHDTAHSGVGYAVSRLIPYDEDLRRAADLLNEGKKVAILIGAGAKGADKEVLEIADVLGAGIAKALLGKSVIPDDLPFVTGAIGLLGTRPSWQMMTQCDTLLMIGSGFPYAEFLPKEGQARGVQIDIDGRMLGIRYPMEVILGGDSGETIKALLPYLKRKTDRTWRDEIEKNVAGWWKVLARRAMNEAKPLSPERVFWEASSRLPENSILTGDSGSSAAWIARDIKLKEGMMFSLSGGLASMGSAVPYAIAAKFAYPDRPVIGFAGDGAMQMNGINGLITIAKYWQEWRDPRMIIVVLNNGDLNFVTWEMRTMAGNPKFPASQDLPDFPYARYAELIGLEGIYVDSPDQVGPAWEKAFAAKRPVVLEARTDPNVPVIPPHITLAQAKSMSTALAKGDPNMADVILQSIKEMIDDVLP